MPCPVSWPIAPAPNAATLRVADRSPNVGVTSEGIVPCRNGADTLLRDTETPANRVLPNVTRQYWESRATPLSA